VRTQIDIFLKEDERAWKMRLKQNPEAQEVADEAFEDEMDNFVNRRKRPN